MKSGIIFLPYLFIFTNLLPFKLVNINLLNKMSRSVREFDALRRETSAGIKREVPSSRLECHVDRCRLSVCSRQAARRSRLLEE